MSAGGGECENEKTPEALPTTKNIKKWKCWIYVAVAFAVSVIAVLAGVYHVPLYNWLKSVFEEEVPLDALFAQNSSSSPEVSAGVTLSNIQVPGKDPGPPMDIKHDPEDPRKTMLHWTAPQHVWGSLGPYKVKVCANPDSCPSSQQVDCHEYETSNMSLVLSTKSVTDYCVVIHSTASCFKQVHKSQAAVKHFKTPTFAPGNFTVTATATSPSSIRLHIDPPKEKNGNLDGCSAQCSSSGKKYDINCTPDDVDIEVKNLIPSSQYTCRVTFYNNHEGQRLETTEEVGALTPNGIAALLSCKQGSSNRLRRSEKGSHTVFQMKT